MGTTKSCYWSEMGQSAKKDKSAKILWKKDNCKKGKLSCNPLS